MADRVELHNRYATVTGAKLTVAIDEGNVELIDATTGEELDVVTLPEWNGIRAEGWHHAESNLVRVNW